MSQMPNLCVVIKIYNEYEMLEGCIQSLTHQVLNLKQILVVDDGSPDPNVSEEVLRLSHEHPQSNIQLLRLSLKPKPNLDTVGRTWKKAWDKIKDEDYDYFGMLDADTRLESNYYEVIIREMEHNPRITCASGVIKIKSDSKEYVEEINIGAKVGRKDARGSGKVIRTKLLAKVDETNFPEVDWDTWINTKAKIKGFKSPQINNVFIYQERPTTRVVGKNHFRNGRLTYYFGYNPILLLLKMILAKKGALTILRGYLDARRKKWKLNDDAVRKYFGWRFFFHF